MLNQLIPSTINLNHPFKKNDTVTLRKTAVTKNRKLFLHFPNLRHWQVAFCSISIKFAIWSIGVAETGYKHKGVECSVVDP